MDRMAVFSASAALGAVAVVLGCVIMAVSGAAGAAVILVGIALIAWPIAGRRRPRVDFDGNVLRIRGALADWTLETGDITSVSQTDGVKATSMVLGYGGYRYIGGRFTDFSLGAINVAADRRIPMLVVVDSVRGRYVFNCNDLNETQMLYYGLLSASEHGQC